MNILVVASRKWVQSDDKLFKKILDILKKSGNDVIFEHNYIPFEDWTEDKKVEFAKEFEKTRKTADVLIAEVSGPSIGLGLEVSEAMNNKKPTLILYTKKNRINVSGTVMGAESHKNVKVEAYTAETIEKILNDFLEEAKQKIDTKFILIISPEIDRYLAWAADFKRMHKAQVVRNAVEEEMEKDEEYKKYLEETR